MMRKSRFIVSVAFVAAALSFGLPGCGERQFHDANADQLHAGWPCSARANESVYPAFQNQRGQKHVQDGRSDQPDDFRYQFVEFAKHRDVPHRDPKYVVGLCDCAKWQNCVV